MKVRIRRKTLIKPTVEMITPDPVAVMPEQPIPPDRGDHTLIVSTRVTGNAECGITAQSPHVGFACATQIVSCVHAVVSVEIDITDL